MELLKPILLLGRVSAISPFTIGTQKKVAKYFFMLYCVIVLILQIVDTSLGTYRMLQFVKNHHKSWPVLNLFTSIAADVITGIIYFSPRLFSIRVNSFIQGIRILSEGEVNTDITEIHNSRRRRGYFIAIFGTLWVVLEIGFMVPSLNYSFKNEPWDEAVLRLTALLFFFFQGTFISLSLYVVISLVCDELDRLTRTFEESYNSCVEESSPARLEFVKRSLNKVFWAFEEFSHAFSPTLLVIVTVKLVTITVSVFQAVYGIMNRYTEEWFTWIWAANVFKNFGRDLAMICFIFFVADKPVHKIRKFRNTIMDSTLANLSSTEKMEVKMLLLEVKEKRVRLTAGGLFGLGKHLIPKILGTIVTYIVILLQSQSPSKAVTDVNVSHPVFE